MSTAPAPATAMPAFTELAAPARWRRVDFISDLHLQESEPGTFRAWQHYLLQTSADALFILGDLFNVWVGDDCAAAPDSFEARCGEALRVAGAVMNVYFMCGNRDFLMGAQGGDFLARHHVQPLADPTVLAFGGQRYLLTHGDLLCTDDLPYQQFRAQVRSAGWQQSFLARPLAERQALARQMRARSQQHHAKAGDIYAKIDINLAGRWLVQANAGTLIHGHTHQPGDQPLSVGVDGQLLNLATLSDWHITDSERRAEVLRLSAADGLRRVAPGESA
jgi:UDP-2,3-diacylglucosamine hydrolase